MQQKLRKSAKIYFINLPAFIVSFDKYSPVCVNALN